MATHLHFSSIFTKVTIKYDFLFASSVYPRHTKYVEGYIFFVFPSVRPCARPVLTFYIKVLCEVFLYIKKWRWPGVSVPHWALALVFFYIFTKGGNFVT